MSVGKWSEISKLGTFVTVALRLCSVTNKRKPLKIKGVTGVFGAGRAAKRPCDLEKFLFSLF